MLTCGEIHPSEVLNGNEKGEWLEAIEEEMDGLQKNEVLGNEQCPKGVKPLGTRFVLTKKKKPDGTARCKARLVVKGHKQEYGIDYLETFSPVVSFDVLRTILAVSGAKGWKIHTLDFTQAYLNARLKEDIWVTLPDKRVVKLNRALYGLKQAGLEWERTYSSYVIQHKHWKRSDFDDCVFYAINPVNGEVAILWVYVDDSGLTGSWNTEIARMKTGLLLKFPGRDLGEPKLYVGMQIENRSDGIFIHQTDYAKGIVSRYLGHSARTARTLMEKGANMSPRCTTEDPLNLERYPYRRVLGQLLYLANNTRPDLSNSVRELGKVSSDPSIRHWRSVQHVLRYLAGNPDYGLLYGNKLDSTKLELTGFSDADFAGDVISRKSCTGYVIKLGESVIVWASRTQRTLSTSTTEAEWTALYEGVRHGELIRRLLYELNIKNQQVSWFCDNAATIIAANNRGHSGRTRFLDVKLKKTRSMVEGGLINIEYVPTFNQEADGLTKRLSRTGHKRFCEFLLSK